MRCRYKANAAVLIVTLLYSKIGCLMKVLSVSSLVFCMSNTTEAWLADAEGDRKQISWSALVRC